MGSMNTCAVFQPFIVAHLLLESPADTQTELVLGCALPVHATGVSVAVT
jgi:hypothetical protein